MYSFPLSSGFVTSYTGLATARAFLGLVEGPMAPGIVLYFSGFYLRKELSFRYVSYGYCSGANYPSSYLHWFRLAIIFSVASVRYKMLSQMFLGPEVQFTPSSPALFLGCLLPQSRTWMALVENQDGPGSLFSYVLQCFAILLQLWITFMQEGLLSVLVGGFAFYLVPSTPRDFRFLTECQKEWVSLIIYPNSPCINPWLILLSSGSSWTVWKEIDHPSNRLINSISKKSCDPPVTLISSWPSSWPSSIQRWFPVTPFSSHPLFTS